MKRHGSGSGENTREPPETVDEVFQGHWGRRRGMLRALTTEKKELHKLMDPDGDNLSLYSSSDGSWKVSAPDPQQIPSELPEPCLGMNFSRDGMDPKDWLSLVAAHSDAWLVAVAFFYAKNFSKQQRAKLFDRINNLPTLSEVVAGQASAKKTHSAGASANTPKQDIRRNFGKQAEVHEECVTDEDEEEEEKEEKQEDEAYCGVCGGSYSSSKSQLWIRCDVCTTWFHGKCVRMTAAKAEQINIYRCPSCIKNESQ